MHRRPITHSLLHHHTTHNFFPPFFTVDSGDKRTDSIAAIYADSDGVSGLSVRMISRMMNSQSIRRQVTQRGQDEQED